MNHTSLDYKKHNRNRNCGKWTLAGPSQDKPNEIIVVKLDCKGWTCGYCGPRKASKLRKAISIQAVNNGLTKFLTLTLDPKQIPDDIDKVKYIRKVWSKFRVYLKRRFGRSISFVTVLEFTEAGIPHLHILIHQYIPQAWISESWESLGGGRIVYIKRIKDLHRLVPYLAKYFTKAIILSAPKGTRRWTTSRDIRLFEKVKSEGWRFIRLKIEIIYGLRISHRNKLR